MTVISIPSIFWLGISSLACLGASSGAESTVMPLPRFRSLLRSSTLLRQSPTKPHSGFSTNPNVSPNAVSTSPLPLSHMTPRSVPRMAKRPEVSFGGNGPVRCEIASVVPRRSGSRPDWPLNQGIGLGSGLLLPESGASRPAGQSALPELDPLDPCAAAGLAHAARSQRGERPMSPLAHDTVGSLVGHRGAQVQARARPDSSSPSASTRADTNRTRPQHRPNHNGALSAMSRTRLGDATSGSRENGR